MIFVQRACPWSMRTWFPRELGCVQSIRSGNYPVVATNHTLILNWNSQTISLLRQIAINKLERANGAYDGSVRCSQVESDKSPSGAPGS